jgi:hypothetical protein
MKVHLKGTMMPHEPMPWLRKRDEAQKKEEARK